ncbi:MAG TPA: hypothetical protein VK817_00715 [Trebonia sp.]|jgi:hypothetical protein|nr:hypothetical protein [Trebonia sp.]
MPVETKVQASTAAAALSGLALFALGRYVFKGAVPDVVTSWVYVIVPSVITFAAGYLAKHTPRPGDPPVVAGRPLTTPSTRVTWPEGPPGPEAVTSAEVRGGRPTPSEAQMPAAQPPAAP